MKGPSGHCSRVKKKEEIEKRLQNQQTQIETLKQSLSRITGISVAKPLVVQSSPTKKSTQSLSRQNQSLRLQLTEELKSLEEKLMAMFDQNRQENKVALIELLNFICDRHQILVHLNSSISETKDVFLQFNGLIKEGPIQNNYLDNTVANIKTILQNFFNTFNTQVTERKFGELKELIKLNKSQILKHLNQEYSSYLQKKYQKELQAIQKEREMIAFLPKELKEIKQNCRQREQHYKRQNEILEKQLKQAERMHENAVSTYQQYIAELTGKYKSFMESYTQQLQRPVQEIRAYISKEIEIVHEQINKITRNCDIQAIVNKLSDSVNKYIEFKSSSEQPSVEKLTQSIGAILEKIYQENSKEIKKLREMYEIGEADYKEYGLKAEQDIQKLAQQVDQQRKKGYQLDLENKVSCQKQYILLLEQYNNKLQSCIKRIGTKTHILEEYRAKIAEVHSRHQQLSLQYEELRKENEKLLLQQMATKQILSSKNKRSQQIYQLFKQFEVSTNQIKNVKTEISRYFKDEISFQKQIQEQASTFNSAFVEPHSKLVRLNQELPHLEKGFENRELQLQNTLQGIRLQQYENIKKEYEAFFKAKRVVQTRLDKGIHEIIRLHSEYLKLASEKQKDLEVKVDDRMLKSMSTGIILKIEDYVGGVKILRESLAKTLNDLKKQSEISHKEIKTLTVYLKGTKLQRSVLQLTKALGLNYEKLNYLTKFIYSLEDRQFFFSSAVQTSRQNDPN